MKYKQILESPSPDQAQATTAATTTTTTTTAIRKSALNQSFKSLCKFKRNVQKRSDLSF
jgi:hypothetical protein